MGALLGIKSHSGYNRKCLFTQMFVNLTKVGWTTLKLCFAYKGLGLKGLKSLINKVGKGIQTFKKKP